MRQFTTVPPIGLDPVAVLLGHQTGRSNQTGDAMSHQAVMKPEAKISGFIDRLQLMSSISSQDALQSLPGSWDAGAEHLYIECPDGYVPSVLVDINPDK